MNEISMDIIGHNQCVIPDAKLRHAFKLIPCPYPANRIVRGYEQDHLDPFPHLPLHIIEIDLIPPVRKDKRTFSQYPII